MDNESLIKSLSYWGGPVQVAPMDGGITNHNYLVSRAGNAAEKFVVRLGTDIPVHHIFRRNEINAGNAAYAAGIAPAIRYHQPGVLVMDFIEAKTLAPADVCNESMLKRVLPVIQACHHRVSQHLSGPTVAFWVFHVIRDYAATLKAAASVYTDKLPELLAASSLLESAAGPYEIVFAHNDLLSANLLDDGDNIWLIDWEYAGYNSPLFDLGGLASNNGLSDVQQQWLLTAYYDKPLTDELWRRYQAMKTASLLRELMWSMVSEIHSDIDFDYSGYTRENLQRFEHSYTDFHDQYA